jgi:AcrR family transcriptional regulator
MGVYESDMGRTKTLPDASVFAALRRLLAEGGEKAVAFSSVARATGLAAPTLAQRYGTRDAMVLAALTDAWDLLDAATLRAAGDAPLSAKGAVQLLKTLGGDGGADFALLAAELRDPALRGRAARWRMAVLSALAVRLGGGSKGREAAALLFAAWQGQALWHRAGGDAVRIKDAVRRLA